jgi:signal transduction histidine kinase
MRLLAAASSFSPGFDYAPFGIAWLRGLTLARLGIVLALCAMYTLHSVSEYFVLGFTRGNVLGVLLRLAVTCAAALPFTLLVTITDNATSGWRSSARAPALAIAVMGGALSAGLFEAFLYRVIVTGPSPGNAALWDTYAGNIAAVLDAYPADFLFAPLGTFWGVPLRVWSGVSTHWLMFGGHLTAVYYFVSRERAASEALHESRTLRQALDRQMTEAQLQLLQAQIEPLFLFNTLATIKRLYEIAPEEGQAMLHSLADYLRAALPQMRDRGSTLMRELQLIAAYLNVQQIRMGERLRVQVIVPPDLLAASVPPMMLLTLVENAIKHGLNPLPRGGTVRIRATRKGDLIRIAVEDNGAGFHQAAGSGVGLANTRERLATFYGTSGHLHFEGNDEGGITAAIELPYFVPRPESETE